MPQGMYWAYPTPPASISTGDLIIQTSIERDVHKYSFRNDLRQWQGFLFTKAKLPFDTGNGIIYRDYILTPVDFSWTPDVIEAFTKQTMGLASYGGRIHLNRPSGKKAYLHGISFSIYDHHQLVPRLLDPLQCPNTIQYEYVFYPFLNKTLYSAIIGVKGYPDENEDFLYSKYLNNKYYSTYEYGSPFKLNAAMYRDAHFIQEFIHSNRTNPRSNVPYGMLPMDTYHNHFDMSIMGEDNLGQEVKFIWNNKGFVNPNATVNTNHSLTLLHEEMTPQVFNEINLLIDDNITDLRLDVFYPYLWEILQKNENYIPFSDAVTTNGLYTIFKLPVKVDLSIIYA